MLVSLNFHIFTVESCQRLDDIDNGWVEQEHINNVGNIATYKCYGGFFIAGRSQLTCVEGGYWSGSPPSCEKGKKKTSKRTQLIYS